MVVACIKILSGVQGELKIFGMSLGVENRKGYEEPFPAIYYLGSKNEDFKKAFEPGKTWVAVQALFKNPDDINWKGNLPQKALAFTLLKQPAMKEAIQTVYSQRAQQAADKRKQQEEEWQKRNKAAEDLLQKIHDVVAVGNNSAKPPQMEGKKAKPFYPEFGNIQDLLGDAIGFFRHPSGMTFKLCNHQEGLVVYLNKANTGHELESLAKANPYIFQRNLHNGVASLPQSAPHYEDRKAILEWLLSELGTATSGAQVFEETSTVIQQPAEVVPPKEAPVVVASVDVSEVLGAAATNGVPEGTKCHFSAKPASRTRTKQTKGEAVAA